MDQKYFHEYFYEYVGNICLYYVQSSKAASGYALSVSYTEV